MDQIRSFKRFKRGKATATRATATTTTVAAAAAILTPIITAIIIIYSRHTSSPLLASFCFETYNTQTCNTNNNPYIL